MLFSILTPSIFANTIKNNEVKNLNFNRETSNSLSFDLLIIAPEEFENQLLPLVEHKINVGISTRIVTLDEVYSSSVIGFDDAEKLKYFLFEAVNEFDINYVLLVGGKKGQFSSWYIPVRYVNMSCDWESSYISDLYYADLFDSEGNFSSWDSDKDGKYAEWYETSQPEDVFIDMNPDIALGRLPCRNSYEVKIMVNKIINYETMKIQDDWFKKFVTIAGDTYPEVNDPKWVGYEGEYYADLAIENMSDFTPTRLYTSDETLTHWRDIPPAINPGCGFLYFVGHGSPMSWGNHFPNSKERIESFRTTYMPLLKNNEKLPICVVSGCHNSQFDVNIFNIFDRVKRSHVEYVPESWSWRITRKIGGGSVATLGCTALGFTKEDKESFTGGINELEVQFFKQYSQNNISNLGDVWIEAINWYKETYPVDWNTELTRDSWIDAQVIQSWIIFGDPSLTIGGY